MKSSPLLYVLEILRHYAPLDDMLEVYYNICLVLK